MSLFSSTGLQTCSVCKKETSPAHMAPGWGRVCMMCKRRDREDRQSRKGRPLGVVTWLFVIVALAVGAMWYFKVDLPFGQNTTLGKLAAKLGLGKAGAEEPGAGGGRGGGREQEEPAAPAEASPTAAVPAGTPVTTLSLRSDVLFEFGSASLKAAAGGTLRDAAQAVRQRPGASVVIRGYTDGIGTEQANLALSRQRAAAVKDWMVKSGIPAQRLGIQGMGAHDPVAANTKPDGSDNPAGREQNRRVTVSIIGG